MLTYLIAEHRSWRRFAFAALGIAMACAAEAVTLRAPIQDGVSARLQTRPTSPTILIGFECAPPKGQNRRDFFRRILARSQDAGPYLTVKSGVYVPIEKISEALRREALLAFFEFDYVDEAGWHHRVRFADGDAQETWWGLAEWFTGEGFRSEAIRAANEGLNDALAEGDMVLIPRELLLPALQAPTEREPLIPGALEPIESLPIVFEEGDDPDELFDENAAAEAGLAYGRDDAGQYAEYRLQRGEAVYTAVAARFTDFRDHAGVVEAVEMILERSGIDNVHDMHVGTPVRVPFEILSARFKPPDNEERQEFDATAAQAVRLQAEVRNDTSSRELAGVAVILDPGHGSNDVGAMHAASDLYEDEIVYDIMCRIKRILERDTQARVYLTMLDPDQGYEPTDATRFTVDKDEVVLSTPRYPRSASEYNTKVSANLRYFLANDFYAKELAQGTDPRKVVFTSIHCDALLDGRLRGAMIYIPGARASTYHGLPSHNSAPYSQFAETAAVFATDDERRRDEALSLAFAETLGEELGKNRVRRHLESPMIRNVIRRTPTNVFVPAVLRGNRVPTRILFEIANMTNATDRTRLASPEWREMVAEAYVNALRVHYGAPSLAAAAD